MFHALARELIGLGQGKVDAPAPDRHADLGADRFAVPASECSELLFGYGYLSRELQGEPEGLEHLIDYAQPATGVGKEHDCRRLLGNEQELSAVAGQ